MSSNDEDIIRNAVCLICGERAENVQIGRDGHLYHSCGKLRHIKLVWTKYVKV